MTHTLEPRTENWPTSQSSHPSSSVAWPSVLPFLPVPFLPPPDFLLSSVFAGDSVSFLESLLLPPFPRPRPRLFRFRLFLFFGLPDFSSSST